MSALRREVRQRRQYPGEQLSVGDGVRLPYGAPLSGLVNSGRVELIENGFVRLVITAGIHTRREWVTMAQLDYEARAWAHTRCLRRWEQGARG